MRIQNKDDGEALFPSEVTGEPLVRFTARDGDSIDVLGGQDINGQLYWTQIAAKSDGDGFVEGTLTVEFMRNGLPANGFVLNMDNQDGGRPGLVPEVQAKVDSARIVSKFVGAGNYTPSIGTEVDNENAMRSATGGVVYFRDDTGNLYLNTAIVDQPFIELAPGAPLQTAFDSLKVEYGATIEAEAFDNGFDGIAYHDSDSTNSLGEYRSDSGVDATETVVGDIADGEWLEYTTEIVAAGYDIGVNVSSTAAGGQIRLLAANSNSAGYLRELGTVDVPDTGGVLSTVMLNAVDLAPFAGIDSVIRLEFIGELASGVEVDSVEFVPATQSPYIAREITVDSTATKIELEEFDFGGQGIAYNDTTPGNSRGDFRGNEDVDNNGEILTNEVFEGEWLEYTPPISNPACTTYSA